MPPKVKALALLLTLLSFTCSAQSYPDTLELARDLRNHGDFERSIFVLDRYCKNNPQDANGYWLLGETLYWSKQFSSARSAYRQALKLTPNNTYLQLDYARMMLNTKRYRESETFLMHLTSFAETKDAALLELSRLYHWTGRARKAKRTIASISTLPNNSKRLSDEIERSASPAFSAAAIYSFDSQPLTVGSVGVDFSIPISPFICPYVELLGSSFSPSDDNVRSASLTVGNKFFLAKTETSLIFQGGYFVFSEAENAEATYKVGIDQKVYGSFRLHLAADRKTYQYTLGSVSQLLMVNTLQGHMQFGTEKSINGRAGYHLLQTHDDNLISSFHFYALSHRIGSETIKAALGYSLAYNDSKVDGFILEGNGKMNSSLSGTYDPYFTPVQQTIHSLLANSKWTITDRFTLGVNGSVGIFATTQNPYFYLEQKGAATVAVKGFAKVQYMPFEISAMSSIKVRNNGLFRIEYTHTSTFFYQRSAFKISMSGLLK